MDRNDINKNCKSYLCDKCYYPCNKCYITNRNCEQCKYGYMNIVKKFKIKYSREELEKIKEKCQYAKWALEDINNLLTNQK